MESGDPDRVVEPASSSPSGNPEALARVELAMNRLHRATLALALVAFVAAGCGSTAHLDLAPRPAATPGQATPAAATSAATPVATAAQLAAGHWSTLPAAPIPPRDDASVVWTGSELLVWGGGDHDDGAAYDPTKHRALQALLQTHQHPAA